jgi:hypothetical protein
MTTMTRTDIHRPSAVEFDPENYEVLGFADFHPEDGFRPVETVSRLVSEGWSFSAAPHGSGQCSHCGAHLRYAALLGHTATKTLLYVGETCLDNRFSQTASEFQAMRKEAAAKAERTRLLGKAHDFYAEHPDMVILSYARNIAVAGGDQVWVVNGDWEGTTYATEAEALATLSEDERERPYAVLTEYRRGTTWEERARMGKWTDILNDMGHKVERYGELSDKQIAFARKILGWLVEADERLAEKEAVAAAKVAAGVKVESGRQVIEGTVTTLKWQDSDYGMTRKMRVVSGDLAYWGTVPAAIDHVEKDQRVRFTATVEPSRDDPAFGFFKRPSKAEVL